jgi:uncharacterized membrane protein YtjA (UPF0391 family)
MLKWATLFLALAACSAVLGFTTMYGDANLLAKIMVLPCLSAFLIFLALRFGTEQPARHGRHPLERAR